ncbi:unnamed protein product [Polarella glacialis]|uniref:Transporter n=1 Tax=Polarella glacialis TaxID=89957 RepID=A0A813K7S1_POLGL|nr:unnamed protein product [Polarella glacialis]
MAASAVGIITLFAVVLAGPLAWAVATYVQRRRKGNGPSADGAAEAGVSEGQVDGTATQREEMSGVAYTLSLLGYAIGLGNLWRFPYLVGKWGGGAFIIAYLVCLLLVAIPAYLMEMVMGQYTRKSTVGCFKMIHPRWDGLGYGQALILLLVMAYYNVLLAYAIIYIAGSLVDPLPWADDSKNYFNVEVLNGYDDYAGKGLGPVQWKLALALLVVWLIVFASLAFGKKILTKVTWVTVVGPIVMLVVLVLRSVTLDGAGDGIEFYIGKFDSEVLGDLDMWASACSQILFSLSPGFGTAITMSSYTRPKENVFRTCMVVVVCNSAFSLLGGFAIFSIVGNITFRLNAAGGVLDEATGAMVATTVAEQASAGTGLAFIAIADGMRAFGSGTNAMSVLFFSVLLTLGLDSTFCWAETFVCYVEDYLLVKGGNKPAHWKIVGCMCAAMYLMGLLYCTRMGIELLDIVDHYCITYYLLLAVALEAFLFTWDFGWRRFVVHVKLATLGNLRTPLGQDVIPSAFWWYAIHFTMPACSLFLFFYIFSSDVDEPYGGYPDWLQGIGWSCLAALLAVTPLGFVRTLKLGTGSTLPPLEQDEAALAAALGITSTLPPLGQKEESMQKEESI